MKQICHSCALAASIKPKIPVEDNAHHAGRHELCFPFEVYCTFSLRVWIDASFDSTSASVREIGIIECLKINSRNEQRGILEENL